MMSSPSSPSPAPAEHQDDLQSPERIRMDPNEPIVTGLTDVDAIRRSQPVPVSDLTVKHPLWSQWALWFDGATKKTTRKNWSDNLKEVYTFDTVEDFWSVYNNIHSPSQLAHGSNYHLFKHGIKPMWEHEANKRGGKWIMQIPRRQKDRLDTLWLHLSMAMTGEAFTHPDDVCGAVVSVRKQGDKISLWTRTAADKDICIKLGQQFKQLLGVARDPEFKLVYQAHSDSLQNDSSYGNRPMYLLE